MTALKSDLYASTIALTPSSPDRSRLGHENIARVYFVGVDRGWHYIVLEYVEGENARDCMAQQGPLPLATVLDITLQVAESLQHAASRDVVHRDVKPSNVLVDE